MYIMSTGYELYFVWKPLSFFPSPVSVVLAHIEPPALWRMTATDRLFSQVELHPDWPLNDDMVHPPSLRLKSRKPPWRDPVAVDVSSRWCEDWQSAKAMSSSLVGDPTVRAPGFHLRRRQWSLPKRFQTGQDNCSTCQKKLVWQTMKYLTAADIQTMSQSCRWLLPVRWPNSTVVYNVYTLQTMLLLIGWHHMS